MFLIISMFLIDDNFQCFALNIESNAKKEYNINMAFYIISAKKIPILSGLK